MRHPETTAPGNATYLGGGTLRDRRAVCGAGRGARLSPERGTSQSCQAKMPTGPQKRHTDCGEPLVGRLGIGLYDAGARGTLSPNDHGPVPLLLARGNRDKTLEERARCGRVASESTQPPGGGVAPWEIALGLEAGAAYAAAAGGTVGGGWTKSVWARGGASGA